jgi:hypothetical protein
MQSNTEVQVPMFIEVAPDSYWLAPSPAPWLWVRCVTTVSLAVWC